MERELERLREELAGGELEAGTPLAKAVEQIPQRVADALDRELGSSPRRVINATGVLIHTNLGRTPLPAGVAPDLPELLDAYCDLEFDLRSGSRDERNRKVEGLLRALTGAPAALVVNNNAAALVLVLATLARGREVVVSRGELVEIGGSFRIPSILEAAGTTLREVGTTNRTRLADYESALSEKTGLLLKVFPSNYRITGFVAGVDVPALVELGRRRGVPLLVDEGSGLLRPHPAPQLADHRSLSELMKMECDLACGSGDKLLGGPQAGILVGGERLVRACQRNPLYRALRPDRGCLASLSRVLRRHMADGPIPLDRMWPDAVEHRQRVRRIAEAVGGKVLHADGYLGGGSAPEAAIPGEVVALPESEELRTRLRQGDPPVVAYQREGHLLLDLRTVGPEDEDALVSAVLTARGSREE